MPKVTITMSAEIGDLRGISPDPAVPGLSESNIADFLHDQMVCRPLESKCEELAKEKVHRQTYGRYAEAWIDAIQVICDDRIDLGRRLMESIQLHIQENES